MSSVSGMRMDPEALGLTLFLTSYDPSDLPGSSIDPLGFERGYLHLADKILPGLTNVADRPRYFSVLCSGAYLAEIGTADSPRDQYQKRLDCVQRIERFWALANVLASDRDGEDGLSTLGIRGITYAQDEAGIVLSSGSRRVDSDFPLLSRQVPYGVIGIYGAVAEGMRFLERKTLCLTPDLGERLAEGFLNETDAPNALVKAVRVGGDIAIVQLIEWGRKAHVSCKMTRTEASCFDEVLHRDPLRSRMALVLSKHPVWDSNETELERMKRLLPVLGGTAKNRDLFEAVQCILAYEECYRLSLLGFERLLWLCRTVPSAAVPVREAVGDATLKLVHERLTRATAGLCQVIDASLTGQFLDHPERLNDTRQFLERASIAPSVPELCIELVNRHSDVQRGKFDRGRRKMPWLEMVSGRINLTMTRVGGLDHEVGDPSQIAPHPYRLSSADSLIRAAKGL